MGEKNQTNKGDAAQDEREQFIQRNLEPYLSDMAVLGRAQGGHLSMIPGVELKDRFVMPSAADLKKHARGDIFDDLQVRGGAAIAPYGRTVTMYALTQWGLKSRNLDPLTSADLEDILNKGTSAMEAGFLGASKKEAVEHALTKPGQPYTPKAASKKDAGPAAGGTVSGPSKVAEVQARLQHLLSQVNVPANKFRSLIGVENYIASELAKGRSPQAIAYGIVADGLDVDIGNLSAERDISSVADPVQEALQQAGYGPANPDVIADAYVEGRASGLTHEEAVEYAAGVAKETELQEDVRTLKEAAKWNAPDKKNIEQNINKAPGKRTIIDGALYDPALGAPLSSRQPVTDGALFDPALGAPVSKPTAPARAGAQRSTENERKATSTTAGESLWEAVQKETDARRAAEQKARDRRELSRAAEIDARRNVAARAAEEKVSVAASGVEDFGAEGFVPSATRDVAAEVAETPNRPARETVTQMTAAAARAARERTEQKPSGRLGLNQDSRRSRATDGGGEGPQGGRGRRGGDHGAEGFVPGAPHESLSLQPVTDAQGRSIRSSYSGFAVTTGGGRDNLLVGGPSDNSPDSRVICTELVRQGRLETGLYFLDLRFAEERLSPAHLRGYHLWAVPLVRLMRRSRLATNMVAPLARWRAEEVARVLGRRARGSVRGKIVRLIGEPLCWLFGQFVPETDYSRLYEQETSQ